MKKISILLIIIFLFFYFFEDFTDKFRLVDLTYKTAYYPTFQIPELSAEIDPKIEAILDQKFTWISHGHQVHVFSSEDKKYVLKLFKFRRLIPNTFLSYLSYIPLCKNYCEAAEKKRLRRIKKLFGGYHLAYVLDSDQTGIKFVKFIQEIPKTITLIDRLGITHRIDANNVMFAIQEQAVPTKTVLRTLLDEKNIEKAKQRINAVIAMYKAEYSLGIVDQDHNVLANTGFVGDKAIRLDVGQLSSNRQILDPEQQKQDLDKIIHHRIYPWIKKHYPDLADQLLLNIQSA